MVNDEESFDEIERIEVDNDNRVTKVFLKDKTEFAFKDFIDVFKSKLNTIVAGEIISWDDEWRYQRQIDPKTMEQYLDVVEAEGLVANSKFNLTRGQKISLGIIIVIVFVLVMAAIMLKNSGLI